MVYQNPDVIRVAADQHQAGMREEARNAYWFRVINETGKQENVMMRQKVTVGLKMRRKVAVALSSGLLVALVVIQGVGAAGVGGGGGGKYLFM